MKGLAAARIAGWFIALVAGPAGAAPVTDVTLASVMELSGLNAQIEAYPDLIRAGAEASSQAAGARLSDSERINIQAELEGHVDSGALLDAVAKEVKQAITEAEARELLRWYGSPLGKQIAKAERSAGTPEALREIMRKAQSLMLSEQRVAYAERVESLYRSSEVTLDLQDHTNRAMITAITRRKNPDKLGEVDDIMQGLEALNPNRRADMRQLSILAHVYAHKQMDLNTVRKYLEFLESHPARKFHDAATRGLLDGLHRAIDAMAEALAARLVN